MPEDNKQLQNGLNEVTTLLIENEAWNAKAANECRKIGVRGWGDWHTVASITHKKCLDKLGKCLMDKLKFAPQPNPMGLENVNEFEMRNIEDFIQHHFEWIEREKDFAHMLKNSLIESKKVDRELHEMLEKLQEESHDTVALVKQAFISIKFGGFMPHDISVKSKWLQDYFKYDYKPGDKIMFHLG